MALLSLLLLLLLFLDSMECNDRIFEEGSWSIMSPGTLVQSQLSTCITTQTTEKFPYNYSGPTFYGGPDF